MPVKFEYSVENLQGMVEHLFVDDGSGYSNILAMLGTPGRKPGAVNVLLEALKDPRVESLIFHPDEPERDSPFGRICYLLIEVLGPVPEAAHPIAQFMRHSKPYFRSMAATSLGRIATLDCLEPFIAALRDPQHGVRATALSGLSNAIKNLNPERGFLDVVFPELAPLLREEHDDWKSPAVNMVRINREKAVPILLSPENFTTRNPSLHSILVALNLAEHSVPHAILLPLLRELEGLITDHRRIMEFSTALLLYARNPDAGALPKLRSLLNSPVEQIAESAASALEIIAGIKAESVVMSALNNRGFDRMLKAQRHYLAVLFYDGEVNNGGHWQYFYNSSGSYWDGAIDGLYAIGAASKALILEEAVKVFGGDGPSLDWETRRNQMEDFGASEDQLLNALDDRYYESAERITVLLSRYAQRHKNNFLPAKPKPRKRT